jgi:RNA 3'-terminal phosphate cyclase (ATP)
LLPFLLYYPASICISPPKDACVRIPRLDIHITGGTNVPLSPSIDYLVHVLLPILARIGLPPITAQVDRRGWSTGGTLSPGSATFTVEPLRPGEVLHGFELGGCGQAGCCHIANESATGERNREESRTKMIESKCWKGRGALESIFAAVVAPGEYEAEFRQVLEPSIRNILNGVDDPSRGEGNQDFSFRSTFEDSGNLGRMYFLLVATCSRGYKFGRDWLLDEMNRGGKGGEDLDGVVGKCIDKVANELRNELQTNGCVDEYAQDQIIIFQALAKGRSSVFAGKEPDEENDKKPSIHTKTARWVIRKMLKVSYTDDGSCEGIELLAGANPRRV